MTVYIFGTVCSPSAANFALRRTAEELGKHFYQTTVSTVKNCFYIDDCLTSVDSIDKAKVLVKKVKDHVALGGFNITKWISNSCDVTESIPKTEWSKIAVELNLFQDQLPFERALGLKWHVEDDTSCFRVKIKDKPNTRREILSAVSLIYDPLVFGAPIVQPPKVMLQHLCKLELEWDNPVSLAFKGKWVRWLLSRCRF